MATPGALDRPPPLAAAPENGASAPRRGGIGEPDLIVVVALALLAYVSILAPTLIRVPFGVLAVFLLPGYAVGAAVFPTNDHFGRVERLGLSLGASIAVNAVTALILNRVPGGLSPDTIRLAVTALTIASAGVALVRRHRAGVTNAASPAVPPQPAAPAHATRFTQAIIGANVIVAALAYTLTIGGRPADPTEFYVVGPDGLLAGYPRAVTIDEQTMLRVGVTQAPGTAGRYDIVARSNGATVGQLAGVAVEPGRRWDGELGFVMPKTGLDQEVLITLNRPGEQEPVRTLRLWVDVEGPG